MVTLDSLITRAHISPVITAPDLMAAIRAHFGSPTIDLAATAEDTVAPLFISPDEDSLTADWHVRIGSGLAFLNPPSGDIYPWIRKCHYANSHILALIPAALDADWWWLYVQGSAHIHVLTPRPTYDGLPIPMCIVEYGVGGGYMRRWEWQT